MAQDGLRMWGGFLRRSCRYCDDVFLTKKSRDFYCSPYCRDKSDERSRRVWKRAHTLKQMEAERFSEVLEAVSKVSKARHGHELVPSGVARRLRKKNVEVVPHA